MEMDGKLQPRQRRRRPLKRLIVLGAALILGLSLALGLGLGLGLKGSECDEKGDSTKPPPPPPGGSTTPPVPPTDPPGFCPPRSSVGDGPWNDFRLPRDTVAQHYDVDIEVPDLAGSTYSGEVRVRLALAAGRPPGPYLLVHIRGQTLTAQPLLEEVVGGARVAVAVADCFSWPGNEYLVVEAERPLEGGTGRDVVLTLRFSAPLVGTLVGFYSVAYVANRTTRYIAATDHEPTDARKSFPCLDEPDRKATFTVTLSYPADYSALSNMPPEENGTHGSGLKWTRFARSVPMSTYLVCFAVHQFIFVERISSRGVPLRVYVQPEQKVTAEFAANATHVIFDYFESYFGMNYSLPKLDQIAIPDFGTGAMENWGLITYRETNLLYDPSESSSFNQQRVAAVVAHELTHQWFGNIVTMAWWDDLWLNEGFASYFEFLGVQSFLPEWRMIDYIMIDDVMPVMGDDALTSSHAIIVNVTTPSEITAVFDSISYSKGASLLRMLSDWIGQDTFQRGCQNYLRRFHFTNAKTDDFWEAMAQESGEPVKEVMDTWTRQMGLPLISLRGDGGGAAAFSVEQRRFLLDPNADPQLPASPFRYTWHVPLRFYTNASNVQDFQMFNMTQSAVSLTPDPTPSWLKLNPDHVGFYRVNYSPQLWALLLQQLQDNHTVFSDGDRAGFIDDAFSLARAGLLPYETALNATLYVRAEGSLFPWDRVLGAVAYLRDMLADSPLYPLFQKYWRQQVKPITAKLTWKDEGEHLDKLLREQVLGLACRMGDEEALSNATNLFDDWKGGQSIAPNVRLLVYRYGMQQRSDDASWEFMLQSYLKSPLAQEKDKLLYGLASTHSVSQLARYLELLKNESVIRSQDMFTVLRYISLNPYGKTMAWDWTRLNWEYLVGRFGITDRNLGRLVQRISTSFNTELQLWQMESFFSLYPEAGAGASSRLQALETLRTNIAWVQQHEASVEDWLQEHA
ncbi:glutamyl aminopeptidase isoform X2 [Lampetra planeri]